MIVFADFAAVDYQHQASPRQSLSALWTSCVESGSTLGGLILRGAYGTDPDPTVDHLWNKAVAAGLTCGAYLFLRMPRDGYHATPEEQVRVFATTVGTMTERNFAPALDFEDGGVPPAVAVETLHRAWLAMRSVYGVSPMIYDSARVWHEVAHDLPAAEMVDSPQWTAKPWPWAVRSPAQLSGSPFASGKWDPVVPDSWGAGNWWLHQYQGDAYPVPGFSHTVDLSRFRLMTQGETGPRVDWVRSRLGMPALGKFDAGMLTQVKAFQARHGLVTDGVVGPKTFASLSWTTPGACR